MEQLIKLIVTVLFNSAFMEFSFVDRKQKN